MTIKAQETQFDPEELQKELNWLFKKHGLKVSTATAVGHHHVVITSSDERVRVFQS